MSNIEGIEVFGVEELEKQFERTLKKIPTKTDAMLKSLGLIAKRKVANKSPVLKSKREDRKPGQLKGSWRTLGPTLYETKNGSTKVIRVQSAAPHAHLIEDGHEIVTRRRSRDARGRYAKESHKIGKVNKLSAAARKALGVKSKGRVKGRDMLKDTMKSVEKSFYKEAEKLVEEITNDYK